MKKLLLPFIYCCVAATGCIKQVTVETRIERSNLVVEGGVTNDAEAYTVKLTYSGHVRIGDQIPDGLLEKDATVTISDDEGNTTGLSYADSGIYRTTNFNFIGRPGHSYTLRVQLKNGKTYISTPEKMPQPVPVDDLKAAFDPDFNQYHPSSFVVTIDATDPAGTENYYKWDFLTWIPRHSNGISCGFGCVEYQNCFQKNADTLLTISSDATFNGSRITGFNIGRSYVYWFGKHYLDVTQQSLTRENYQFWELYRDQKERTGSILDPLPASIKGNVHNEADENDIALGYFSAVGVTHKKIVLVPQSLTEYWLKLNAITFIPSGEGICFEVFPNTLPYPPNPAPQYPPPPGWETAPELNVSW